MHIVSASNKVSPSYVAVQIGYEKTAYTVTERESEVEVCICVTKAPVPANFVVLSYTQDDSAGKKS